MKTLATAMVALIATAGVAGATDLPSKKKAPAAVAAPVAAASTDSLTVSYGQDLANNFGSKVDDAYSIAYKHSLPGGIFIGGVASTTQAAGSQLNQNLEAQAGVSTPSIGGLGITTKLGVGERFSTTNFPYYAVYTNADYDLGNGFTINAIGYRYRNAFDAANGYQSHQLSTGVTYALTDTYSINAKVSRSYDSGLNATGDAVTLGLGVKF